MKRLSMLLFILAINTLLPRHALSAGLCCQISSGVQESFLGVASPEAGKFSLQTSYGFTMMDKLKEGSQEKSLQEVMDEKKYTTIPTEMAMSRYTLTAAFGLTPNFSAFVSMPYVRNTMEMVTVTDMGGLGVKVTGHETMTPVQGQGDVTLMGMYRIFNRREGQSTDSVSLGLGVKTPTGSATRKSASGNNIHAHMQPGTGSWDPIVSLLYTKGINPFLLQANATYQLSTRNQDGYDSGSSFMTDFSGKYTIAQPFNIVAGLTYFHLNQASDRDGNYTNPTSLLDDTENTGGDSLWFSPGIQVLPIKNGSIDLKVQFPLWEHVNGVQLVSSYRILAGISYTF